MAYRMAGKIIDQYDSPALQENLPQIKTAGIDMTVLADVAPDRSFALCIQSARHFHRKFPISSVGLTKTSMAFFVKNRENLPEEMQKTAATFLKEAAERFELPVPSEIEEKADENIRHSGERYVHVHNIQEKHAGITKARAFQNLTDQSHREFAAMIPLERVKAAAILTKLGSEIDKSAPAFLQDYAPRPEVGTFFKRALEQRQEVLKNESQTEAVEELQELFKSAHNSQEAIELLAAFDAQHSLNDYSKFMDPYQAAYGGTPLKEAAHAGVNTGEGSVEEKLKKRYLFDSLVTNMRSRLMELFDAQTVDRIQTDPEEFYNEAPANVKRLLDQLTDEAQQGVDRAPQPYFKHKRPERVQVPVAD